MGLFLIVLLAAILKAKRQDSGSDSWHDTRNGWGGSSGSSNDPFDPERLKREDPGLYTRMRQDAENRYK